MFKAFDYRILKLLFKIWQLLTRIIYIAGAKMYIAWYIKGYNIVERKVPMIFVLIIPC